MNNKKSQFLVSLIVVVAFFSGFLISRATVPERVVYTEKDVNGQEHTVDVPLDLGLFWEVWNTVDNEYVEADAFDEDKALYGAIKGLVESVGDSYTVFMDPTETKQFQQNLDGRLEGIGAEVTIEDGVLTIITPLKNSPAEQSGIQPGDVIYRIDGEPTSEMTLFGAIMKIRGEKGTVVELTIIREGLADPFDIKITRGNIEIESVSYELLDNKIAYISINQFSDTTEIELSAVISQLLLDEARGIILDLRYNGGGYLDISVEILSEFLKGEVKAVTLKRRLEGDNQVFMTNGKARVPDLPLVVLINRGSASASEIVAGAIQDYKRGYLIGEQSFGKGSVQEVIKLGDASLRLTVAKWFTPNDRGIDHLGITPDKIVGLSEEDITADRDPQLDAAKEYIRNLIGY